MRFTNSHLQQSFADAVNSCQVLTAEQATQFVELGFCKISGAFSVKHAEEVVDAAWTELSSRFQIDREDPTSWQGEPTNGHSRRGYFRTQGNDRRYLLSEVAPDALSAQTDVIGGAARLHDDGKNLKWGNAAISNLGIDDDPRWEEPSPYQPGWHKDGWHFRHFMHSPEQGLLVVPIYSHILPKSGGTVVAADSLKPVAQLLRSNPQGLHPDSVQGAGYLIPGLVEQCSDFRELTGEPGDMYVIHPYVLHRVAINPTTRPRFIANMALVLKEPMPFLKDEKYALSLVELAVFHALGEETIHFDPERELKAHKPFPFRNEEERTQEQVDLKEEMRELATRGIVSPGWATQFGYMSNREYIHSTM